MKSKAASRRSLPARDQQQERVPEQTAEPSNTQDSVQENIAKLAHALWQSRGCPMGSAEQDWIEAERQMSQPGVGATVTGR